MFGKLAGFAAYVTIGGYLGIYTYQPCYFTIKHSKGCPISPTWIISLKSLERLIPVVILKFGHILTTLKLKFQYKPSAIKKL